MTTYINNKEATKAQIKVLELALKTGQRQATAKVVNGAMHYTVTAR